MRRLRDTGMLARITIAFLLFVFLPVIATYALGYTQLQRFLRQEVTSEQRLRVDRHADAVRQRMREARSIADNVSANPYLQHVLARGKAMDTRMYDELTSQIYPAINSALRGARLHIYRLRIFFRNASVPEGYGVFFREARLMDRDWYKGFVEGDLQELWLIQNGDAYFEHGTLNNTVDGDMVLYARRIWDSYGATLGVLVMEIQPTALLADPSGSMPEDAYVLHGGSVVYVSPALSAAVTALDDLQDGRVNAAGTHDGYLRASAAIEDFVLGEMRPMGSLERINRSMNLAYVIAFIAMLAMFALFFLMLRGVLRSISRNIDFMAAAVESDTPMRIPVRGGDEIGRIAEMFNVLIDRVQGMIQERIRKETAQKDAQLGDLQYRISPHFFYNTLDILGASMVMNEQFEIAEAVAGFGKMLRYSLGAGLTGTLEQEMRNIQSYVQLQKVRYGDRVRLTYDLPGDLRDREIIRFILQPIVENSILHGYRDAILHVHISFMLARGVLHIVIADDGIGMDEAALAALNENLAAGGPAKARMDGTGIGLENIRERLELYYGSVEMRVESQRGVLTRVLIGFPFTREGDAHDPNPSGG